MPTILTHAVVGLALGSALRPARSDARWWLLAGALPMLPDIDTPLFGAEGASALSHRGATHSFAFAAAIAAAAVLAFYRGESRSSPRRSLLLLAFFFLVVASHGVLDAFTDGGDGIMFWWPFDDARVFWPSRPVAVAPLFVHDFFSEWGADVLASEARWIGAPAAAFALLAEVVRRVVRGARPAA